MVKMLITSLLSILLAAAPIKTDLSLPAYPLVTIDPYTSAWSMTDTLYDSPVRHWTAKDFPLTGAIAVDGVIYRFMGVGGSSAKTRQPLDRTAVQRSVEVHAMNTCYTFRCGKVDLSLTFTAPLFLDNLDLVSRPVNYISYEVSSTDGKKHDIRLYLEASPQWAVDTPDQATESFLERRDGLLILRAGTLSQQVLAKKGDDRRIDWGYFYLAAEELQTQANLGRSTSLRQAFTKGKFKSVTTSEEGASGQMALIRSHGKVSSAQGKFLIGYDDLWSIQYFGTNLRPWWNRKGDKTMQDMLQAALSDYPVLMEKAAAFDRELYAECAAAGGKEYAELCSAAYRQSIAAHKLVEAPNGDLLWLSKENFSNGSIGTVDVTYPSAPLFLRYNPELAKGLLNHIFFYTESGRWGKPFPSHDVGTYPHANGQTYGGDMPVEESGNMIILSAAICLTEGRYDYARAHWNALSAWTDYLVEFGLDPENQLCTDDFAGHFAHNTNLSIKAIMAIACYGRMAEGLGLKEIGARYTAIARDLAARWKEMARDGDHYRLTFDRSGTWSQKYNLVWDKVLGLNIFPDDVARTEIAWYLRHQNTFGLPLDSREEYTKTDWILWSASLSEQPEDFRALIGPVYRFYDKTGDRIPMSDWVHTTTPTHRGFRARSVVGGFFIKALDSYLQGRL